MINTVLMDLDGTLIKLTERAFSKAYFTRLCGKICPLGYTPEAVTNGIYDGIKAMRCNDGSRTNYDAFWEAFEVVLGKEIRKTETMLEDFYRTEFDEIREVLLGESCAKELVETLKAKGYTLVLATNPLFPAQAQYTRMSWAGLTPDDFAHVTHYENSHFCKPNPRYYEEILQIIGKAPDECMMIGNNASEDMAAAAAGLQVYLVTDHLENAKNLPIDEFEQGSLEELLRAVKDSDVRR